MRIGIFGGSFNPVHAGHLKLAGEALSELNLNQVYFVPSRQSPLKKKDDLLPESLRLKQLRAAIKNRPAFKLSLCELKRPQPSYTVDTLRFFSKKFGKRAELYFLSGADTLKNISKWKSLDEIFKLCRFVVMSRPGFRMIGPKNIMDRILPLAFDAAPVSSTDIRRSRYRIA